MSGLPPPLPSTITITKTEESPGLALEFLFPFLKKMLGAAGIQIDSKDISLAHRILVALGLPEDDLTQLSEMVEDPKTVLVKLPNISATILQLQGAIKELKAAGHDIPDYPEGNTLSNEDKKIQEIYKGVLGSVVNPLLRKGTSIRYIPDVLKKHATENPHPMGEWSQDTKTRVLHMGEGDFYGTEKSQEIKNDQAARIEFVDSKGKITILKPDLLLPKGAVVDTAIMRLADLQQFLEEAKQQAKDEKLAISYHFKATMMMNTDGVFFGHAVKSYFAPVFKKYSKIFLKLGVNAEKGMADVVQKIGGLSQKAQDYILADIEECLYNGPPLAMNGPEKTNLTDPSMIIDVSMARVLRDAIMNALQADGSIQTQETLAVIPDRTYAEMYQAACDNFKKNGALDPAKMGTVPVVGLMAQRAQEYGSKNTTFTASEQGTMRLVTGDGAVLQEHTVNTGDVFRLCKTTNESIHHWLETMMAYIESEKVPAILWLDENRPHDQKIIAKVKEFFNGKLPENVEILSPVQAMEKTLTFMRENPTKKTPVAVTGNVLRDYLTDLFPFLEVNSSSVTTSLVPMMRGGGLMAETGAGGTAPDLFKKLRETGKLTWNSLGEFIALEAALRHLEKQGDPMVKIMADTLEKATAKIISKQHIPSENGMDTRMQQLLLLIYWTEALERQQDNFLLKQHFSPIARALKEQLKPFEQALESKVGTPVKDIKEFYNPDLEKVLDKNMPFDLMKCFTQKSRTPAVDYLLN